jgi:hypothetical protein
MNKVRQLYPPKQNPIRDQLVTLADLRALKAEILLEIQLLLTENKLQSSKKWLKTYEVITLLGISNGTLQTLRKNGRLPYTKIGNIIFYDKEDINKLLSAKNGPFSSTNLAKTFYNHAR